VVKPYNECINGSVPVGVLGCKQQKSILMNFSRKRNSSKEYRIEVRMDRELEEPDVSWIQGGNELPGCNHTISLRGTLLLTTSWTRTLLVALSAATTTIPLTFPISSAPSHGGSKP